MVKSQGRGLRVWLGLGLSGVALFLALRQVELSRVWPAFAQAHYGLIGLAVGLQLMALGAIAGRWRRLFRQPPALWGLFRALLVAQMANVALPVRLGVLVRAYLVGREAGIGKTLALGTVLTEKVFDSLAFVLLFATVLPFVAPGWFRWSAMPTSTGLFLALFPALVLLTTRRRQLARVGRALLRYVPGAARFSLSRRFEMVLEGLGPLQGIGHIARVWLWTLLILVLGGVVNAVVMAAFGIPGGLVAAFFLLAVLQMGARIPAPLGGIGVFQYLCVEALSFFNVEAHLALSFGFMLHFVVFVPGSLLGALGLYRMHESLPGLRKDLDT